MKTRISENDRKRESTGYRGLCRAGSFKGKDNKPNRNDRRKMAIREPLLRFGNDLFSSLSLYLADRKMPPTSWRNGTDERDAVRLKTVLVPTPPTMDSSGLVGLFKKSSMIGFLLKQGLKVVFRFSDMYLSN